jgi:hypothetical protein
MSTLRDNARPFVFLQQAGEIVQPRQQVGVFIML